MHAIASVSPELFRTFSLYEDFEVTVVDVDQGSPYECPQFLTQSTAAVDGKFFLEQVPEASQRATSQSSAPADLAQSIERLSHLRALRGRFA